MHVCGCTIYIYYSQKTPTQTKYAYVCLIKIKARDTNLNTGNFIVYICFYVSIRIDYSGIKFACV